MAGRYPRKNITWPLLINLLVLWSCHPVLPATPQSGYAVEMRVVTGQQAVLPCPAAVQKAGDGNDVTFILFSFVTSSGPARIYRVNNLGGGKETHWAARGYESRALVHWQPGSSPARLVLEGITLKDQGVYGCHIQRSSSTTLTTSTISLTVFAPPTSLKIYSDLKPDTEINGTVGPYDLEEVITYSCRVTEGHPRPNVTWWEGSRLLEDSHVTHTDLARFTTTRSDITVGPLTHQDLHRKLTCRASNSDLYDSLEASVMIDLRYPPSGVSIVGDSDGQLTVRAGVRQEVVCEVLGGRPTPSIMLRLDQAILASRSEIKLEEAAAKAGMDSVTATAELVPGEEQEGSLVTCVTETPPFQHVMSSVRLAVLYPPRVQVLYGVGLNPKYVKEDDDFIFQCDVTANPSVTDVTWSLDGETLLNNPSQGVYAEGLDLYLEGVSRSSSGEYRCAATNSEGEVVSDPLYLNVRAKPEAVISCSATSKTPTEDKLVTLEVQCASKADGDLSKIFLLEVQRVGRSKAEKRLRQHKPVFTIKGLREGRYRLSVTVTNDLGDSPPYTFIYTIQPPTSTSSSSSSSSSFTSSSSSSLSSSSSSTSSSPSISFPQSASSSHSSSSSISVSPSLTSSSSSSSSVSITTLTSAIATSAASSISPTPSLFSFSLSTSFSSPISPHFTKSFSKTPPPSSAFLPSPSPGSRSSWRNPWAIFVLVMVAIAAVAHVGCLVPQLLVTFFIVKLERRAPPRQRLPSSPRFPRHRNRNSNRELIRAHRLSDPPLQLPTITISPPTSPPPSPLNIRKGSLTLEDTKTYNFLGARRAPHASVDSMELSSLCPSLQDEPLDTYSLQDESVQIEQPRNGTLPRARPHNGSVRNGPFLNNNFQDAFLHYNFIEKDSLKRDLMKRTRSRPASPNFLTVDAPVRRSLPKEPSYKA